MPPRCVFLPVTIISNAAGHLRQSRVCFYPCNCKYLSVSNAAGHLVNRDKMAMRRTIVALLGVVHAAYDKCDRPVGQWIGINQVRRAHERLKCRALC